MTSPCYLRQLHYSPEQQGKQARGSRPEQGVARACRGAGPEISRPTGRANEGSDPAGPLALVGLQSGLRVGLRIEATNQRSGVFDRVQWDTPRRQEYQALHWLGDHLEVPESYLVQRRNRVGPQPEPCPLLAQPRRLLKDDYLKTSVSQGRSRRQPTEASPYDRHPCPRRHDECGSFSGGTLHRFSPILPPSLSRCRRGRMPRAEF
jgi:hypothetical protein